ncbi:APC family permease [Novosphingobium rosa]|uniref:APC family permease n=1 Tax=Novosphingobium rosa TaxID=76978 RepID=UPI00082CF0A3|nr:APC family permease [Novosphingobium rosa]
MANAAGETNASLSKNSLGLAHIVFFVVAAAAPLTAVVGTSPAAFAFGNGAGVPGAFVLAGLLYLLFSVGFTAMSRHVAGAGGFYVFISSGLGSAVGIGGAFLALVTYSSVQISVYALLGVFARDAMAHLGVILPWYVWSEIGLIMVLLCGQRNIAVSGHILGACMIAEIAILFLLDLAIIGHGGGPQGLSAVSFAPHTVFGSGLGVALVFVIGSYIGFESTVIFGEEAKNPDVTIRRATFTAVILITAFYAFSTWAIAQYFGPDHIQAIAAAHPDQLFFTAAKALLGDWAVEMMNVLLIVSLLACSLSLHSTLCRYLFALGREGLVWRRLGHVHERHGSPQVAGMLQSITAALIVALFAAAGADPYGLVFSWSAAFAVLGILLVQALVCLAIIAFFRRPEGPHPHVGVGLLAPGLSLLGLMGAMGLVIINLPLLAGTTNPLIRLFPVALVLVLLAGVIFARQLRARDPKRYETLGQAFGDLA